MDVRSSKSPTVDAIKFDGDAIKFDRDAIIFGGIDLESQNLLKKTGWWFQIFFIFIPAWGRFSF